MAKKVFFFGLDNAGKTTLVHRLKTGNYKEFEPSIEPNSQKFTEINILVIDFPGQKIYRNTWSTFVFNPDLIAFVIDLSAINKLPEIKEIIEFLFQQELIKHVPKIIIGTKIELNPKFNLSTALDLNKILPETPIVVVSAKTGSGIEELITAIKNLLP